MDGVVLPPPKTKKTVTIAPLPECSSRAEVDYVPRRTREEGVSGGDTACCEVDSQEDTSSERTTSTESSSSTSHGSVTLTDPGPQSSGPLLQQDCEPEVQAFLEDGDKVLDTLDRCQAEDKCLMLIKRPKESARKMLKSHTLSQMSVSDPQLYRQFNGVPLTQVHQHAQTVSPTHQDDQTDRQSTTSNSTEGSETRRRYLGAKDRLVNQPTQCVGVGPRRCSDYARSDSCPSTSDLYQYLPRRDRDFSRRELRYSSIPEDEDQEINNNKGSNEDSSVPCQGNSNQGNRAPLVRQDQSPNRTLQSCPNQRPSQQGRYPNYEPVCNGYGPGSHGVRGSQMPATHDPRNIDVDARSRSMSSVSSGLTTFSLVGQRKADSLPSVSLSPGHPRPRPQCCVQAARQVHGEAAHYWDTTRSPERAARSPPRPMANGHSPRHREGDRSVAPGYVSGSYQHPDGVHASPRHHPRQYLSNGNHHLHHPHHLTNGDVDGQRGVKYDGHGYRHGGSDPPSDPAQTVLSPLTIRTNMPPSSVYETSERLKRFTEVMRSRMSVSSCGDVSTTSSTMSPHTPTAPHTPPSCPSSLTEQGWDSEVSTLLEVRLGDGQSSPSRKQNSEAAGEQGVKGREYCSRNERDRLLHHHGNPAHPGSSQETPNLCSDQHSDAGQTSSSTSHSHSSTMDSGYTTNTECEGDMANHLSPPYHPSSSYPNHQHHHPVHTPRVHAEPYRPVPMPRNLFPTSARKSHSGQTVGGTHQAHGSPRRLVHPEEKPRPKSNTSSPQQQKRAGSQCVQVNGNSADLQPPKGANDPKPGWSSAPSFTSLDLASGAEGHADAAGSSGDDLVLKPQVVSRSSCQEDPGSPHRANGAVKAGTQHGGEPAGNSTGESGTPSLSSQAQESSNSVITVPGHWNHNNGNVLNNSSNTNNPTITTSSSNGVVLRSSPRSPPKPNVKTTPIPTLFQLSQCYDLCSARLTTPASLTASSLLTLGTVEVSLPAFSVDAGSAAQSPQGHCARIGGPGSAFRPVRSGSATQAMELTAVDSVEERCGQHVLVGDLQAGDLLVEVNGVQCLGQDPADIQALLDTAQELTVVVARKRRESTNNRVQELESSVQKLEEEVDRLAKDLSQKDARIEELSSMLPWTQDRQSGETTLILQSDDGAFVIGENEFVV